MTKNIMIVGVGGQGTLLASKMLGYVLLKQGYDVKVSEVHWNEPERWFSCNLCKIRREGIFTGNDKGEADVIISLSS